MPFTRPRASLHFKKAGRRGPAAYPPGRKTAEQNWRASIAGWPRARCSRASPAGAARSARCPSPGARRAAFAEGAPGRGSPEAGRARPAREGRESSRRVGAGAPERRPRIKAARLAEALSLPTSRSCRPAKLLAETPAAPDAQPAGTMPKTVRGAGRPRAGGARSHSAAAPRDPPPVRAWAEGRLGGGRGGSGWSAHAASPPTGRGSSLRRPSDREPGSCSREGAEASALGRRPAVPPHTRSPLPPAPARELGRPSAWESGGTVPGGVMGSLARFASGHRPKRALGAAETPAGGPPAGGEAAGAEAALGGSRPLISGPAVGSRSEAARGPRVGARATVGREGRRGGRGSFPADPPSSSASSGRSPGAAWPERGPRAPVLRLWESGPGSRRVERARRPCLSGPRSRPASPSILGRAGGRGKAPPSIAGCAAAGRRMPGLPRGGGGQSPSGGGGRALQAEGRALQAEGRRLGCGRAFQQGAEFPASGHLPT